MQAVEQAQPSVEEELQEAIPDWMQETAQAAAEQPVEDQAEAGDQLEAEVQFEAAPQAELPVTEESEIEPAELSAMEPQEELEAKAEMETPTASEAILPGMEEEQIPELPDWLSDETAEKVEEEEEEWSPTEVTLPVAPQYPLDINTASLTELERLPGIGFIMAQEIIEYRERSGPFTSLEDLRQVPGLDESILEDVEGYLNVQAPEAAVAPAIEEDESHMELIAARNALIQGSVEQAVDRYTSLVKNRQFLNEVIRELQEATIRYPVEVSIWQTLGDAYLRTDQLQEALDAYNKAEELLS
jgi:competence ComEA-like helix-hairpin-helix protein